MKWGLLKRAVLIGQCAELWSTEIGRLWRADCPPLGRLILCSKCSIFVLWAQHQVIRQSVNDKITVVRAGITLHEALAAADDLSKQGRLGVAEYWSLGWKT